MVVLFCLFRRDQSNPAGGRAWRSSDRRTCRSRRRELEQDRRNNRWNPAVCCASPPEDDAQQHLDLLRRPSAKTFFGHLCIKTITLPRQARDKIGKTHPKNTGSAGDAGARQPARVYRQLRTQGQHCVPQSIRGCDCLAGSTSGASWRAA